jgi:hypothetical protein
VPTFFHNAFGRAHARLRAELSDMSASLGSASTSTGDPGVAQRPRRDFTGQVLPMELETDAQIVLRSAAVFCEFTMGRCCRNFMLDTKARLVANLGRQVLWTRNPFRSVCAKFMDGANTRSVHTRAFILGLVAVSADLVRH